MGGRIDRVATVAWRVWWALGLLVPFVQLHATSVEDSGWVAFALWALAAGWLSLWTPVQRNLKLGWLAVLVLAWLVHPLVVSWPILERSEWIDAWGLLSRVTASGCFAFALAWGTASALRHSPRIGIGLAFVLCAVLSVNLWFQHLQTHEVWSRWIWNEKADLGGLFSSRTVSSAWCVIALPLLIAQTRWRKLLALPALYGVAASGRTTVFVALAVWLAWSVWPWVKRRPWVGGLSLTGFALAWFWRVESIGDMIHGSLPRLATWPVILRAIVTHPLGIGWNPIAYFEIISASAHPIMGHPSSGLLAWTLAGGWALGAVVVWMIGWTWTRLRQDDGFSGSLVVCTVLVFIQRTIAQAQVGVLAWALWCLWRIERSKHEQVA